jgi:small subunit ribosomal protein S15
VVPTEWEQHDRNSDTPWRRRGGVRLGIAVVRSDVESELYDAVVRFLSSAMARMHSRRRGSSGSDKPAANEPPEWSDVDPEDIEARVVELADQGYDPSQIGMKLRDEGVQGTPVPDVKLATDKKVTEILEEHDADSELPEDLRNLMERAIRLNEHMDENPQDHQNKRALQNTESKVRRLADYYRGDVLDEEFSYSYETAKELLE